MISESASTAPSLSVIVPVKDEADNVAPLIAEITAALRNRESFEIVYVDDGSSDGTLEALTAARANTPELRVVRHQNNAGQSAGLRTGVRFARAPLVATLDGDGQNIPADIPKLLEAYRSAPAERRVRMAAGQRVGRKDTRAKRWASRAANKIRAWMLDDDTRDTGCGLKLFDRQAFLDLPYFDHLHRFLPAMMKRDGHGIVLVDVGHRPRIRGASKYGVLDRALLSIRDLMGVMWLMKRRRLTGDVAEL